MAEILNIAFVGAVRGCEINLQVTCLAVFISFIAINQIVGLF
jgi:hypothetical protein